MNKFVTKLAGLSVGLALALGVGFSVGERAPKAVSAADVTDTLTRATTGIADGGNYGTWSGKSGGSSSAVYAGQSGGGNDSIQLRSNNSNSGVIVTTSGGTLKSISVVWNASTANGRTLDIYGKNTAYSAATDLYNNSTKGDSLGTIVYGTSTSLTVSGSYTFFGMRSNSGALYLTSITVVWTTGGPVTLPTPTGVAYDDTTTKVTWNAVANATGYKVSVDSGEFTADGVDGTSWSAANLTKDVQHTISVKAIGDGGTNYNDSAASTAYNFTPKAPTTIQSVTISGGSSSVDGGNAGTKVTLTAAATNATGTGTSTFTWASSNTAVATVNSSGVVTYVGDGSTDITATSNYPAADGGNNVGTKSITISNLKGTSTRPFTVSEAVAITNSLSSGANNGHVVYVTGVVSGTVSVSNNRGTFNMTQDTATIKAYSITGVNNTDTSSASYVGDGYTVVVTGVLINYNGNTPEVGFASGYSSSLVSSTAPKTISSIAVKTAPTKTAYKSGEAFNATGLVITATYSDTTTEDFAYADYASSFTFSPSTITEAGDVTITFRGKTCKQAVTLVTVTNVTGVASAPTEVYQGGSIEPSSVTLNVVYSDSSVGTVTPDTVTCDTTEIATGVTATATYNAATGTKSATFTVDVKKAPVFDLIVDELTLTDTGVTDATYASWSNVKKTSGAVYAGFTNKNSNGGIGMRQDTSKDATAIIVTASEGVATKIEVTWTTDYDRTLVIKGQNDPYTTIEYASDFTGEEVGSITYNDTTANLSKEYKYICIYLEDKTAGFSSIKVTWKVEGAAKPLEANPELSTGAAAEIVIGKSIPLTVTTNPVDSDERLIVTNTDSSVATIAGSDREYVINAVAVGTTTITIGGFKGAFSSSVVVTVIAAQKSYNDKALTPNNLGLAGNYEGSDGTHSFEDVDYVTSNVCKQAGFQFKKTTGYLYNDEELYSAGSIKSITLVMKDTNIGGVKVYEGSSKNPDTEVAVSGGTFATKGVNTYIFSSGKSFFKIMATDTAAAGIDKIIIELADAADAVLAEARAAANSILTDLAGLCGGSGSGYVTQAEWDTLNAHVQALNLSDDAKQLLKDASRVALDNLAQGSAVIENAMGHYDACVEKFGYEPVLGLSTAVPAPRITPTISEIVGGSNVTLIIVIATSISVTLVAGYFLFKKRKQK